ncbi:MAG: response regulator [Verrucomicrobiota bacterium]
MALPVELNGAASTVEKVSILIVDDRPDKLLTYEVMLGELDADLVRATSGREALRRLLQRDFAVILLDVNMPGMDGFETAAMIRQRARSETTPIIFISAVNDTVNHVARGYSLGAVDYILTPVVPEILRAKIGVFVDLFRKTEQVKRQAEERAHLQREQVARAEAEMEQRRLGFLAEGSNVLATSLDYEETFQNLARVIVPRLADFCIIDVADEDGQLRRIAIAGRGVNDIRGLSLCHQATEAFKSAKPQLCCPVDEECLRMFFDLEEDRQFVLRLQPKSIINVPLLTYERSVGSITVISTASDQPCGHWDLSLLQEMAHRAAIALDNASLYQAAQAARAEAERASKAKDRFLAMLSHELRTPLTPVLASVCALEEEKDIPASLRDSLQVIRRNVELEARLIDDLLDLTRISKGKVQLNLEVVDAHTLLLNALEICQAEIDQKSLALEVSLTASQRHLEADPARLQQVFWNLIKNAVKFSSPRGTLALCSHNLPSGELRVEVVDSGAGVSADMLEKIFDAFEQGEGARKGGLGLGLAISKAMVESHHGKIWAESPGRGKGAKFVAVFPTSDLSAAVKRADSPVSEEERRSLRILLVEDHHDTNRSLTRLLKRRGYEVESASNMEGGVKLAAGRNFDVLISDIGLPDGSGIELMSRLQSEGPVFGIALTGFGMEEDISRTRAGGFNHHLIKPVDLNKLDALLQTAPVLVTSNN